MNVPTELCMSLINQNESSHPTVVRKLMTVTDVAQFAQLGESTIWEMSRRGTFPKPIKLGTRVTRWLPSEVDRWLSELTSARPQAAH